MSHQRVTSITAMTMTQRASAMLPFPWSMPKRAFDDRPVADERSSTTDPIADASDGLNSKDDERAEETPAADEVMRAWLHTFVDEETGCGAPPPMS